MSKEAKDFLNSLLQRKVESRLGSKGGEEVKEHAWFADLDWVKVGARSFCLRSGALEVPPLHRSPTLCIHFLCVCFSRLFQSLSFLFQVYNKETTPEFAPGAGKGADYDGADATHFDEEFTNEKAIDSVVNTQLSVRNLRWLLLPDA